LRLAKLSLEYADELIVWLDPDGRLVYGNSAVCRALGYSPDEFRLLSAWDISPRTPSSWPVRFAEVKRRLSDTFIGEWFTRGGEFVSVNVHVEYVKVGDAEYLFCCGHDLRGRQTAEENREAEPPFSSSFESSVDAIFVFDEGRFLDCSRGSNQQIRETIRHDLETMLGESGTIRQRIARALQGEEVTFNWYSPRRAGPRAHLECTLNRIEIAGQVRVLAVAVDITERRKSERTLALLSGRLLKLQDDERRRIARDLHDTTGQHFSALSIRLSNILASPAVLDPRLREGLRESIALADACLRDIRAVTFLLHPPLLDELGLESALRAYAEGYAERTGIRVDLDLPSAMQRLPQEVETTLFRIVQEGLSNIHRHSGSETAFIRLHSSLDSVDLEVVDHGRGLPPGTLEYDVASASRIGVGIAGMRERARQLGGRLAIASGETGTTLHIVLPIAAR
jgi:two-component system NarL family sensor kinase